MGFLKVTYGGEILPIMVQSLSRNITPPVASEEVDMGATNGITIASTTYGQNTIMIGYLVRHTTAAQISRLRRTLAGLTHSKTTKRLVISDEPNLYYEAILDGEQPLEEGHLSSTGTLTFIVPDGLAHSVTQEEFPATRNPSSGILEATILNKGTEAVPVDYTIRHNHENGYIGIVSAQGVIQLGHVNEVDKVQRTKSEMLFDYRKPADYNAMTTGQAILGYDYPLNGSFRTVDANGRQWLGLSGIGSGSSWHGAGKMVTVPNDSQGVSGSSDFYVQGKVWFETGLSNQTGMIQMAVGDENGRQLASIRIAKYDLGNNIAWAIFDVGGVEKKRISFAPAWDGVTASDKGHIYIDKKGGVFNFYFGGTAYPVSEPSLAGTKAKTVSIFLGQHGTMSAGSLLTRMYFDYLFFRKDNVHTWEDVPNRYGKGSEIYIDGGGTKVYVDGILRMEDEIRGSDYFHVPPGETKIQFMHSDFSNPPPTITAKIKAAYL